MIQGFWKQLKEETSHQGRGIFVLAPMADVTDPAFRRIIAKYGKPDVFWTEFVSADGLVLAPEPGRGKLLLDLAYTEAERPIVAQFFTASPEHMEGAAQLAHKLGFDGVDINMGCPDRSIERQGSGAALMKDAKRARELIRRAKAGAPGLPVSIKIRLGYNKPVLEEWLPEVLEEEPAVITIHARTRKEMSKVPAQWEFVKRAVEIRDASSKETLIIGNGDVENLQDGQRRVEETGCDGVMFGRAIFGNPWLFAKSSSQNPPSTTEKLRVLVEHTKLYEELMSHKSFAIMKKHFKAYVNGFPGAAELRQELMATENSDEVRKVLAKFLRME